MKIHLNKTIWHQPTKPVQGELKQLFEKMLASQEGITTTWINEGEVAIEEIPPLQLHSFVLEAEKLGKKVKYTKQTVITVID